MMNNARPRGLQCGSFHALNAKSALLLLAGIALATSSMKADAAQMAASSAMMPGMSMPMASGKTRSADSVKAMDAASTLPVVTITNVVVDNDSAKIEFQAVPGAADYRVYDVSNPMFVKYAGVRQSVGSDNVTITSIPSLEVEWNGMTAATPAQLVVEAVNAVGPNAPANLYDVNNSPLYPSADSSMGMLMLGSDEGATNDGLVSINGQGAYTNFPVAIARSLPFTVTPSGTPALPSGTDASQVVYDTFTNGTITTTSANPLSDGLSTNYTMQSDAMWDVQVRNADTIHTQPFIMGHHFMDVLFDGGTPGTSDPLHTTHGALAMSPQQAADISSGKMLHLTMEVDAHVNDRRWVGISLSAANDPITNYYSPISPSDRMNKSNNVFLLELTQGCTNAQMVGVDANGNATIAEIAGTAGGNTQNFNMRSMDGKTTWNGRGLDDRSRVDLFITQTHYAEYEDGVLQESYDIPGGLPFSQVKVYFVHYAYHSALGLQEEEQYTPYEKFWINSVPYSDERHWDNMGFEVLPSTTDWSSLASRLPASDALNQDGTPASGSSSTGTGSTGSGTTTPDTTATVAGVISSVTSLARITSAYINITDSTSGNVVRVKTPDKMLAALAVTSYNNAVPITVTYTVSTNETSNGRIQTLVVGK